MDKLPQNFQVTQFASPENLLYLIRTDAHDSDAVAAEFTQRDIFGILAYHRNDPGINASGLAWNLNRGRDRNKVIPNLYDGDTGCLGLSDFIDYEIEQGLWQILRKAELDAVRVERGITLDFSYFGR
ncbi:MAG: hypothetical protein ABH879_10450 [archaeon]